MRRLGDVVLDEESGVLTVRGQAVELDRNGKGILALLMSEPGKPFTKEQLLEAGWPRRLVHENSLAKAIGRLRSTLEDTGLHIESVYGIGYQLDGQADAPTALEPDAPAAADAPAEAPSRRGRLLGLVLPVLALVTIAAVALFASLDGAVAVSQSVFPTREPIIGDAPDSIGIILWVDDHPQNNAREKAYFENHRIAVHAVTTTDEALSLLSIYQYRMVVSDLGRGDDRLAGLKLVEEMRRRGDDTPVFIYTLRPNDTRRQAAQRELVARAGAQGVAVTPLEIRDVVMRAFGNPPAR